MNLDPQFAAGRTLAVENDDASECELGSPGYKKVSGFRVSGLSDCISDWNSLWLLDQTRHPFARQQSMLDTWVATPVPLACCSGFVSLFFVPGEAQQGG